MEIKSVRKAKESQRLSKIKLNHRYRKGSNIMYEETKGDLEEDNSSEEEEMIITTTSKKRKRGLSFEDQEGVIEPVPYEAN